MAFAPCGRSVEREFSCLLRLGGEGRFVAFQRPVDVWHDRATLLPFVDDDHVLLVQQFRYITGRNTWEMPTGGVHPGESTEAAAQRELGEEAGVRAGRLTPLTAYATSKSVIDETAHLFLAHDLVAATAQPDTSEDLQVRKVAFAEVLDMVLAGEIVDSMTIIAVLWADRHR